MGGEKLKSSRPNWGVFFSALYLLAGIFLVSTTLPAQEAEPSPGDQSAAVQVTFEESTSFFDGSSPSSPVENGPSIFVVLRMVLVLALCALAIYGVYFFIRRFSRPPEIRDPHLKILARLPLSADTFVAVVSVGAKAWLVGGSSGGVNLISEISDSETLETMLLDEANRDIGAETGRFDFGSLLRRFGASKDGNVGIFTADILRKQRDRLKRL